MRKFVFSCCGLEVRRKQLVQKHESPHDKGNVFDLVAIFCDTIFASGDPNEHDKTF